MSDKPLIVLGNVCAKPLFVRGMIALSETNRHTLRTFGVVELETTDRLEYAAGRALTLNVDGACLRFLVVARWRLGGGPEIKPGTRQCRIDRRLSPEAGSRGPADERERPACH